MEGASSGAAEAWRGRVAAQRGSGQSIRAWCRAHNHHEHAFYWWRSRLSLSPKTAVKRQQRRQPAEPLKFAEVVVNHADAICLRLGGGRELVLPASMPLESIAQLVRAIEGKPSAIEGKPSAIEGVA